MLINARYRRMWFGQAVSQLGDMVFTTSLMLWIATELLAESRYAPLVSSAVLGLVAGIVVVVSPLAGVLVDRWPDKRRIMLITDQVRAGAVAMLTIATLLPDDLLPVPAKLGLAVATVAVVTVASQFFNPARFITLADVVDEGRRGAAASYGQASSAIATIIGPALAGPLLALFGVTWAFGLNAISFTVSYLAIRGITTITGEPSATARKRITAAFAEGIGFIRSHRRLRALLLTGILVMVGAGALSALDVYFVLENLHAPRQWFGYISAALGAGALIGSLAAGRLGDKLGHTRVFHVSLLTAGLAMLVYSRLTSTTAAMIVITLYGLCAGALETVVSPLTMAATPREYLGRVVSVYTPSFRLASMISIAGAGAVAGLLPKDTRLTVLFIHFGRIDLIFLFTALMLLVGAAYAVTTMRHAKEPSAPPRA